MMNWLKRLFAPRSGEHYVAAVGLVPNREDRLISLHVGPCWTLMSLDELRALCDSAWVYDRRRSYSSNPEMARRASDRWPR